MFANESHFDDHIMTLSAEDAALALAGIDLSMSCKVPYLGLL